MAQITRLLIKAMCEESVIAVSHVTASPSIRTRIFWKINIIAITILHKKIVIEGSVK